MAANRAAQKRTSTTPSPTPASNTRSALIWGSLAFCSILAVCSLIALRIGASDSAPLLARATIPPPQKPVVQKPPADSEFEIARLNDAIRTLAAERDRLAARVDNLEQALGDITASINTKKEQAETKPEARPETPPAMPAAEASAPAPEPAKPEPVKDQPPAREIARAPEEPAPVQPPVSRPAADSAPAAADNPPAPKPAETANVPSPAPAAVPSQKAPPAPQPAAAPPQQQPQQQMSFFPTMGVPSSDGKQEPTLLQKLVGAHTAPGWIDRPGTTGKAVARPVNPRHKTRLGKAPPTIVPLPPEAPDRVAANSPAKSGTQTAQTAAGQQSDITGSTSTVVGIDLGGETSIDGLRARWAALKDKHRGDLGGLRPLVQVREGSKPGTVELHLIAGPVANTGTAARVCASLKSGGVPCQASDFEGQKLSVR